MSDDAKHKVDPVMAWLLEHPGTCRYIAVVVTINFLLGLGEALHIF